MASLFDMMTPAPAGTPDKPWRATSGVKEIVSRIDNFGKYIKPNQTEVKHQPICVVKPQLLTNPVVATNVDTESPSPRAMLGDYTCDSESQSSQDESSDELPEMLDEFIKPKDTKQPKQPKQKKNRAHDISKLFFHLSKAFEIIGDLNGPYGLNESDA